MPVPDAMIESLRAEILLFGWHQFWLTLFTVAVALILSVISRLASFAQVVLLVPIVLISGTFAIGRTDLLMHRAGSYIERREAATGRAHAGWEQFKAESRATAYVPLYDLMASLLGFWLFVDAEARAWRTLPTRWRLRFVVGTTAVFVAACLSIPLSVYLARSTHGG